MGKIRMQGVASDSLIPTPPTGKATFFYNSTDLQYKAKLETGAVVILSGGTSDHTALTNIGTNTHAQIDTHLGSTSNPHGVTKTQVGLGNVDNTSDLNKPISDAQSLALRNLADGDGSYYFTNNSSDLGGGRLQMTKDIPAGGGASFSLSGVTNGQLIAEWASISGERGGVYIPSGTMGLYVNALQTGGTKTAQLYAEFGTRTILGVTTIHATSQLTFPLTGLNVEMAAYVATPVIEGLLSTDRFVVRLLVAVSGSGTDPDIQVIYQGATTSRVRFPFESIQSVAGKTGVVTLDKNDVGLGNVDNTSDLSKPISTAVSTALSGKSDTSHNHTGTPYAFSYYDASGDMGSTPGYQIDATYGTFFGSKTVNALATTNYLKANQWYLDVNPSAPSNEIWFNKWIETRVGSDASGFKLGDNTGGGVFGLGINTSSLSESSIGRMGAIDFSNILGNGTDAITADQIFAVSGYVQIQDNTVTDYIGLFNLSVGSVGSGQVDAFSGIYINTDLDDIVTSFHGLHINGTATFTGGSSYSNLIDLGVNFTDVGNFTGINVGPTITGGTNATGININMSSVTVSGQKRALDINGDVSITGSLSFTGAFSIGQLGAFYSATAIDGGGNPLQMHGLTTGLNFPASTTTANVDAIGVNNAMLVTVNTNSINTSGAFKLGASAIALPCVVETHTGSSLDYMNMATYALNLSGTSTGGTIDRVNAVRAEAIPNGITTVNEFVAFEFNQTFGQVGTDVWGIHLVPTFAENHIGGSLNIGSATRKVTNSSVAFEIESTTKAMVLPRMTTTQRNALTAIAGMMIFNTTTNLLNYYDGSSWV